MKKKLDIAFICFIITYIASLLTCFISLERILFLGDSSVLFLFIISLWLVFFLTLFGEQLTCFIERLVDSKKSKREEILKKFACFIDCLVDSKKFKEKSKRDEILEKFIKLREKIQSYTDSQILKKAEKQLSIFFEKESALNKIISLNGGRFKAILTQNSLDVLESIVENYRRLSKYVVTYEITQNNAVQDEMRNILHANEELLELYDRLIEEVCQIDDGANEQNESLQSLIINLQELRKTNFRDNEEDSDDEPFKIQSPFEELTFSATL